MIRSKLQQEELNDFYQSKFDYFRTVSGGSAILIGLLEMTYFVSDCQVYGRFANESFIPRMSIIIPLIIFLIFYPKVSNYKIGALLYYMIPLCTVWCTIWSYYNLTDRFFIRESFIVLHFAFLAIGLAMPLKYHIISHSMLILSIIISSRFLDYSYFSLTLSFSLPIFLGVVLMLLILENTYADHYLIKKQLEISSISDELTKVYNRYILNNIIDSTNDAFALEGNLVIMIIDIDFFKNVNDTYGHVKGDEMLKFVADELKSQTYERDYVIRWGGEEFILILANRSLNAALLFAESLREDIRTKENGICPITISIGVYNYQSGENYHKAIDKADKALYYAKEHGRDQVINYADLNP